MRKYLVLVFMAVFVFVLSSCGNSSTEALGIYGSEGRISAEIQKPELNPGEKCRMVMILHGLGG
ncbi:MAG: hypothetical protein IJQ58_07690, partial [Synergistaceae bacterium]|nr:hypothetical protein [Synergistaceae bacterium]